MCSCRFHGFTSYRELAKFIVPGVDSLSYWMAFESSWVTVGCSKNINATVPPFWISFHAAPWWCHNRSSFDCFALLAACMTSDTVRAGPQWAAFQFRARPTPPNPMSTMSGVFNNRIILLCSKRHQGQQEWTIFAFGVSWTPLTKNSKGSWGAHCHPNSELASVKQGGLSF